MESMNSPLEAFAYWVNKTPDHTFLRQPLNRVFKEYTFKEADQEIRKIASSLKSMGFSDGSHIALLSKNCAHWIMADLAIMMAGCISIPIYPTLSGEAIKEILIHSESKAIIIGKLDDYSTQQSGIPDIPKIGIKTYGINESVSWENLITENEELKDVHQQEQDELITIMYTSGTTGNPKGVMHAVGSFNEVVTQALTVIELPVQPRYFSYLPLTHIAERIGIEMCAIYRSATISFPESLDTFAEDLAAVQPHTFFAVPRIWSKFQEKILEKMPQKKLDRFIGLPIIGSVIKKSIRKKLGVSASLWSISGAAPIAISLQEWFAKLGVNIAQGYGMTEDCILSTINRPHANKFGTVGQRMPGVETKLSAEGEILIKNKCLMKGYYKEPEKTAEMFSEDGFLKTGDIGEFDHDGYLKITGRVKDQFKTDKGKYISPAPIELELLKNLDIEQVCIVGTGIPQPIALIVPSEIGKQKRKDLFMDSLINSLNMVNPNLEPFEKVAKAIVMKEDWSIENGLLTPTLKVKRNRVEAIHMEMYTGWFDQSEKVVYE